MPLPKDGEIQLFQVVDTDGNPARVSLIAGVYRLAVDALLVGPAGAYAQGDFDSTNVDEANALAMWVRAATTGLDTTQAVGSRNVPIAARAALAAQAYGLERLLTDGVIRVDNGTTYSAMAGRGAVAAQAYTLIRGLTDAVVRGDDGATYSAVAARNADAAGDFAAALIGILVNGRMSAFRSEAADWDMLQSGDPAFTTASSTATPNALHTNAFLYGTDTTGAALLRLIEARDFNADADVAGALIGLLVSARNSTYRNATGDWARWYGDTPAVADGTPSANVIGAYTNSQMLGEDNTAAATLRAIEARGAVAAQAYTLNRLFADAVIRGDDGTTYSAVAVRNMDASGDVAAALIGLLVNNRNAIYDALSLGNWQLWTGNISSVLTGLSNASSAALGANVNSIHFGTDTTGAAVLRPVEARAQTASNNAQFARALNGLLVSARQRSLDQGVTATAAAGSAVTLTLPAPGASLKQFILEITITKFSAALLVAAAAPVVVTTTNLTGNPSYDFQANAAAPGTIERVQVLPALAIEATAENTAVTIVCPATTDVIWRVSVRYYNA